MTDTEFAITFEDFGEGLSPLAHIDDKTFTGSKGQASEMTADVISNPGFLQQSPALANLTNGTQAGVVSELIRFILDKPTSSDTTYALGATKLFKLSSTAVNNTGWPRTITGMTEGESVIRLKNNLFSFYNKSSGGDIAVLPLNDLYLIKNPGTTADDNAVGTVAWSDTDNAKTSNDTYATATLTGNVTSHYLKLTNLGFALPADAVVKGIIVSIERKPTNAAGQSVKDSTIKLVKGGVVSGDNKATTADWTTTEQYHTYGTTTDLWGLSWAYSDINASDFGVVISVASGSTASGGIANIDHVKVTVYYTSSSDGELIMDWGSTTDHPLEDALHPSAAKEDIMVFGNGRYLGVYIEGSGILDTQKLDFGEGAEVADVVFHANIWWIAVNYGEGRRSQIYLYDGSAMSNVLSDEVGLGSQEIGFLYVVNGIVYVAYDDLSADGFALGWISGRQLKPLRYFAGTLPNHRQKTLYKSTILFSSGGDVYSFGAPVEQVPIQISRLADGGYATVGAVAAPFGTPMISSSDGATNHRLAQFSGLSTDSDWKSIFVDVSKNRDLGKLHTIVVNTKALTTGARADITIEGNQGAKTSTVLQVTGLNKTRHVFKTITLPAVEDIRVIVDYQNGSTSANCPIRKITCLGNFTER